jgi:hypothetical protein
MKTVLRTVFAALFCFCACNGYSVETLHGEVRLEAEPVYALFLGIPYPPDIVVINRWALEDAAAAFSGMIYGWAFVYEPGEKARGIQESLELAGRGEVQAGDTRLKVTDAVMRDGIFYIAVDYSLDSAQQKRMLEWISAPVFGAQAFGYGPLQGGDGVVSRGQIKEAALKNAIQKAIRDRLRLTERNRPRTVTGLIALSKFPLYGMRDGLWVVTAGFRMEITGIEPFAAY